MTYTADLAAIVESRIGVRMRILGESDPVLRHVRERVRVLALSGPEDFVERIASAAETDPEYLLLIRTVTNGQTFFFRDDEQLAEVVAHLAVRARATAGRTMQIWSAGCATGEEPYSLVMLALERGIDIRVLATDVNDARIEHARRGRYDAWALRHVPRHLVERYFEREDGAFVVRPSVRSRVDFACHNVFAESLPEQPARPAIWDMILCRNLFIYLSHASVTGVVRRMCGGLAPDGLLVLGTAESLRGFDVPLTPTNIGSRVGYRHAEVGQNPAAASSPSPIDSPVHEVRVSVPTPVAPLVKSPELRAYMHLREGRLRDAGPAFEALVAAMPDRWELRLCLGHVHLRNHALEHAMAHYEAAEHVGDVEVEPSFFRGLAALKSGDLATARAALRRVLFLEDTHWRAALLLAGVLERQGDGANAVRTLVHARETIARGRAHPVFRSFTEGIPAATLSVDDAERSIAVRLAALAKPNEKNHE